jgi:hypothetical protein
MSDKAISKPTRIPETPDRRAAVLNVIQGIVELATGVAASDREDWYSSAGRVLQRVRGGRFTKTLVDEIRAYRDKGRIKDDYFQTEQGQTCMQELLNAVDDDSPDEIRFNAMKAIVMTAATEQKSSRNDVVPQQLMYICRSLSSTEVLVLAASYTYKPAVNKGEVDDRTEIWIDHVLRESKLQFNELVRISENSLIEKRLFYRHKYPDGSAFWPTKWGRLTELGFMLCEFIKTYEPQVAEQKPG